MKRNFSELYNIIYDIYKKSEFSEEFGSSKLGLARLLGSSQGKTQHWERGQWPHADDLMALHTKLGFSYRWLVTGEGDPFDAQPKSPAEKYPHMNAVPPASTLPLIGFAACGVGGWHGTMSIPVSVEPPQWHQDMFAVMATGESMLPAGIGHGHICYCDPHKQPGPGEAVYVERMDDSGALKLFLGRSVAGTGEPFINLQGWLDKKPGQPGQMPFNLDVAESYVRCVAPVVYIRRRL